MLSTLPRVGPRPPGAPTSRELAWPRLNRVRARGLIGVLWLSEEPQPGLAQNGLGRSSARRPPVGRPVSYGGWPRPTAGPRCGYCVVPVGEHSIPPGRNTTGSCHPASPSTQICVVMTGASPGWKRILICPATSGGGVIVNTAVVVNEDEIRNPSIKRATKEAESPHEAAPMPERFVIH